jgi:kynurenine formamidase
VLDVLIGDMIAATRAYRKVCSFRITISRFGWHLHAFASNIRCTTQRHDVAQGHNGRDHGRGCRGGPAAAGRPDAQDKEHGMSTTLLDPIVQGLANDAVKVIDLTQTLSPQFPALQLPPEFGQVWAFKMEKISQYDEAGPGWYWNNFSCGEHTGTHFDAPVHWVTGKDNPNNSVDTIDVKNFIVPAVVINASSQVAQDPDWLLTVEFLEDWETRHGRIPAGAWVLFRTDWSKRASDPAAFVNMREDGAHTPGPTQQTVEWLIGQRNVHGFGVETINTDAGQAYSWPVPYPCHTLMHGANRYGLQCLTNLDQLPARGAIIVAAPLKIEGGSGSPLRVLALVNSSNA